MAHQLALNPDASVLMPTISMPDLSGFEATVRIIQANPKIRVLILTMYEEEEVITRVCLTAGASGYLLKDAPRTDLIRAIEVVRQGGQYLSSRALKKVVTRHVRGARSTTTDYDRLSGREREVLKLLADGLTLKEIATRLGAQRKDLSTTQ